MPNKITQTFVSAEQIAQRVLVLRGQQILIDADLAKLYSVTTGNLNKAVSRNRERSPPDFMFQLDKNEHSRLLFQFGTSNSRGGRRTLPYAFTEQGIAMLSGILNSPQAVKVNIEIMRAFVRLRHIISTNKELAHKFAELERKVASHDQAIVGLIKTIRELINTPEAQKKRPIGFIN